MPLSVWHPIPWQPGISHTPCLSISSVGWIQHPTPVIAALIYYCVVLLVDDAALLVAHCQGPYKFAGLSGKQLEGAGLHCSNIVCHEGRVQLKEAGVCAAARLKEIHTIESAEAFDEEQRAFNIGIDLGLSPSVVCSSKTGFGSPPTIRAQRR